MATSSDRDFQHADSTITVRMLAPAVQASFISNARAFYSAVVRKMVAGFPFDASMLLDLCVLRRAARFVV